MPRDAKNCFQEKVGLEPHGTGAETSSKEQSVCFIFMSFSGLFPDLPSSRGTAGGSKSTLLRVFISFMMMMILSSGVDLGVVKCLQVS